LQTKKLRIFHTTDILEDAIAIRTKLQAKILGKGYDTMSDRSTFSTFTSSPTEEDTSLNFRTKDHKAELNMLKTSTHAAETDDTAIHTPTTYTPATKRPKKKDPARTIVSILEKAQSEMQRTELQDHALRQDLDEEIFERTLEKLLQKGDIYFPKKGYVRIVP
jgi:mRNA-degrading endonuclease YafQ of YafQ-DinJ toxin-antitoxin module